MPKTLQPVPAMIAAALVLTVYADVGEVLESLPRPLIIAISVTVIVQLAASAVLRSRERGAMVATTVLLLAIHPLLGVLSIAVSAFVYGLARLRSFPPPTEPVIVAATILLAFAVIRVGASPAFAIGDLVGGPRGADCRSTTNAGDGAPDIYLVLLDAYPRSDTLRAMGYDNSWFEQALAARGFHVAEDAHTNYSWTYLVLPTMFHMAHLPDIPHLRDPPATRAHHRRAIRDSLTETPATSRLRDAGYCLLSAGLPASSLTLRAVDEYIAPGEGVAGFEHQILERSTLRPWTYDLVRSSYRSRVLTSLRAIGQVAGDDRRTFLFSHVLNPHVPFVFDRNGDLPSFRCGTACNAFHIRADQSGMTDDEFYAAYADQVDFINRTLLAEVDQVLKASPDAVVVLFSDHGTRANGSEVTAEWYATFFAARTPARGDLFGDDARPIAIFPRLFNAYLGDSVRVPADQSFQSPHRNILPLITTPWPTEPPR
jgi:hypothetical protein